MNSTDLIAKKQSGEALSRRELSPFLSAFVDGSIPDSDMVTFLNAVYNNGMTEEEIYILVELMIESGEKVDFSHLNSFPADKHSTGGVGDKVSLVLAPILATLGLSIPMISGRSLGHTGGTLDKLESIAGFKTDLSLDDFKTQVKKIGVCLIGQTHEICPADKRMYALRDVTHTIDSIPLICGSIMSKKIAEGIRGLVLDIKVGNGAFMKSIPKAKYLGEMMKKIGQKFGVKTEVVYTSMNQPLGRFAGNWCEVKESVACLQGHGPKDTMKVVFETCSVLLMQSGISTNKKKSIELIENTIHSGTAMEKWLELVSTQGGDATIFDRLDRQNIPKYSSELVAKSSGFVSVMNTLGIGNAGIPLGIGRAKKNEPVDPTAGMEFLAKIGEPAKSNQPLIRLFNSNQKKLEEAQSMLQDTVLITEEKPNPHCLILGET